MPESKCIICSECFTGEYEDLVFCGKFLWENFKDKGVGIKDVISPILHSFFPVINNVAIGSRAELAGAFNVRWDGNEGICKKCINKEL